MGIILALVSAVGFASTYVLIRKGVRPTDPDSGLMITMTVNVAILALASAVLWLISPQPELHPMALGWFIAAGLLGPLVGRTALFVAIRLIGSSRAAAIKNNAPVVVVVTAVAFLGEELSPLALAGVLLVIGGLLLLAYEAFTKGAPQSQPEYDEPIGWALTPDGEPGPATGIASVRQRFGSPAITGIALGIVAAVGFGLSQVARKVGLDITPNAVLGAAIGASAGLASYTAVMVLQGKLRDILAANFGTFRPLLWMAGVTSAIGILSFYVAVTIAPVSHVSVVAASETILTLIFGAMFVRRVEAITRQVALPALAVFGGTTLIALA